MNGSDVLASCSNPADEHLIALPRDVHQQISRYYPFKPRGMSMTIRDSLNGLPFEEQYAFGIDIMQRALQGTLWQGL